MFGESIDFANVRIETKRAQARAEHAPSAIDSSPATDIQQSKVLVRECARDKPCE